MNFMRPIFGAPPLTDAARFSIIPHGSNFVKHFLFVKMHKNFS